MSLQLARLLKQAGQAAPESKPVLEVNPEHPLVKKLDGSVHFNDLAQILFDQAVLAEGGMPEDPAAYVKRVNALLAWLAAACPQRSGLRVDFPRPRGPLGAGGMAGSLATRQPAPRHHGQGEQAQQAPWPPAAQWPCQQAQPACSQAQAPRPSRWPPQK
jgi:hypothetical protein